MKKFYLLLLLLVVFIGTTVAQNFTEVVYLKNGSVIKGLIIEQIPNESLKIQTNDGNVFAFNYSDVIKITKEFTSNKNKSQDNRRNNGCNIGYFKTGYKGFVDLGYTFGTGLNSLDRIEVSTTHGYQINNHFFAGAGVGCNYYIDGEAFVIPLFVDVRANIIDGKITPFADLKLGYSLVDAEGLYLAPSAGCRFATKILNFNVSVGYTLQKVKVYFYDSEGSTKVGGLSLKVGIDF